MTGELSSLPYDLADHLTVELAPGATVSPWPPDGVGEPAVWVERSSWSQPQSRRTVALQVVVAVPGGHYAALAALVDAVWDALDAWRPVTPGVAIDRNAIDGTDETVFVGGDSVPGARFTIPVTYRVC